MDLDPRDYDSRDDERHERAPRIAGTVVPPTTATAMITGGNLTADRAIGSQTPPSSFSK
jgi:hypothetical protein